MTKLPITDLPQDAIFYINLLMIVLVHLIQTIRENKLEELLTE